MKNLSCIEPYTYYYENIPPYSVYSYPCFEDPDFVEEIGLSLSELQWLLQYSRHLNEWIVENFIDTTDAFDYRMGELKDLVPASAWAEKDINAAREAGLITAGTDGYFRMGITREQFAELVVNFTEKLTGTPIVPAPAATFTDTQNTDVLKAYNAGIVNGTGRNTFSPSGVCTREEIAAMLYRADEYIEKVKEAKYLEPDASIDRFSDSSSVSGWARQSIGILVNNRIMEGTSSSLLSPRDTATIEQCIVILLRLYGKIA